jgi:hypothetical protein
MHREENVCFCASSSHDDCFFPSVLLSTVDVMMEREEEKSLSENPFL